MLKIPQGFVVKSIQSGYLSAYVSSGSGEDRRYADVTIAAVNPDYCHVIVYGGCGNAGYKNGQRGEGGQAWMVYGRLTSATNLRISCTEDNWYGYMAVQWWVIEYARADTFSRTKTGGIKSIQTGYINSSGSSGQIDVTISSVVPANCVVLCESMSNKNTVLATSSDTYSYFVRGAVTSATNLRLYNGPGSTSENVFIGRWTVIEYDL